MKNKLSEYEGQKSNFVYWCPEEFPSDIEISWKFRPIKEPGLCIMFLSAKGINGEDLFDCSLSPRDGPIWAIYTWRYKYISYIIF